MLACILWGCVTNLLCSSEWPSYDTPLLHLPQLPWYITDVLPCCLTTLISLLYFSTMDRLNYNAQNTNCYLAKGYENVKHRQPVPFVHSSSIRNKLSVKYSTIWTPCLSQMFLEDDLVLRFQNGAWKILLFLSTHYHCNLNHSELKGEHDHAWFATEEQLVFVMQPTSAVFKLFKNCFSEEYGELFDWCLSSSWSSGVP